MGVAVSCKLFECRKRSVSRILVVQFRFLRPLHLGPALLIAPLLIGVEHLRLGRLPDQTLELWECALSMALKRLFEVS